MSRIPLSYPRFTVPIGRLAFFQSSRCWSLTRASHIQTHTHSGQNREPPVSSSVSPKTPAKPPTPGSHTTLAPPVVFPPRLNSETIQIYLLVFKLLNKGLKLNRITPKLLKLLYPTLAETRIWYHHTPFLASFREGRNRLSWFLNLDPELTTENLEQFVQWEHAYQDRIIHKKKWSPEEDARLLDAHAQWRSAGWKTVASVFGEGRSMFSCQSRYFYLTRERKTTQPPSAAFIRLLTIRLRKYKQDWSQVHQHYPDWSMAELQSLRLPELPKRQSHGKIWSASEIAQLRTTVAQLGPRKWHKIAALMDHKSATQCSNKWIELSGAFDLSPCSPDDMAHILFYLAVYYPHIIRPLCPRLVEGIPTKYQEHALSPTNCIYWGFIGSHFSTPRATPHYVQAWVIIRVIMKLLNQLNPELEKRLDHVQSVHGDKKSFRQELIKHRITGSLATFMRGRELERRFWELVKSPPPLSNTS
ncbi:hypothetical protein H4R33_001842 [Dimargaris cristalligena]|nr:hypothetical protein H4R33_001842 [Dimargaris cristalligena]